jgi:parvulin-like peptidyl-prolyl isomerase
MRLHRIILVTALTCVLAGPALAAAVLKVNAVEVTPGQLAIAKAKVTYDKPVLTGDETAITKAAVDLLVADVLLADAAREAGVAITEKDVKKGIAALRARLGGKTAYGDRLRQLGASEEELKEVGARRMLAQRYIDSGIAPTIVVNEVDARAYYANPENQIYHGEQIHLRMIGVNAPPGISEGEEKKARARLEEAERRVLAGEDFGAVASDMSDDMSKARGGDFGWVNRAAIPARVREAVWAVGAGEMSEVLRGDFGFLLFQVLEKRGPGPLPFEEMKEQATEQLRKSKVNEAVAAIVATRRATAKVEGLTPETAAALKR